MLIFQGFYQKIEISKKIKNFLFVVVDTVKKLCYNISIIKVIPTRKGSSYNIYSNSQWY